MFIVLESYRSDDPRLVPELEYLEQYTDWLFEVAYIKPENVSKVPLDKINYEEVPEELARACKFTNADMNYRVGIAKNSEIHEELMHNTLEEHNTKPKVYYQMNEDDKRLLTEFYKVEMRLYLNMHYNGLTQQERDRNFEYRKSVEEEISNCKTVNDCRTLMHKKFDCVSSALSNQITERPRIDLHR